MNWRIAGCFLAAAGVHAAFLFGPRFQAPAGLPPVAESQVDVTLVGAAPNAPEQGSETPASSGALPSGTLGAGAPAPAASSIQAAVPAPAPAPQDTTTAAPRISTASPETQIPLQKPMRMPKPRPDAEQRGARPMGHKGAAANHAGQNSARDAPPRHTAAGSAPGSVAGGSIHGGPAGAPGTQARYLSNPKPEYPEEARRAHEEGVTLLSVEVGADGRPGEVTLGRGSGFPALDAAAIRAVRRWIFEPARSGGLAIASKVEVPVRFSLAR